MPVKPRFEPQNFPANVFDHSGNEFSKMVQKFSNLADPDAPRLLRTSVPTSMMH